MSRWAGRVAFVLAVAVGGGWAVSLVVGSLAGRTVTPEAASILSTIGGVLAGGIAAYLGNTSSPQNRDPGSRTRASDTPDPAHERTPVLDDGQTGGLLSGPDTQ